MLKYRLISSFVLVPIVIAILFLLPLVLFSIVTMLVCVLAMWEWSQLSGFYLYREKTLLVTIFSFILVFILFFVLKYKCIYPVFLIGCLKISLGWWFIALLLVLFYPYSAVIWNRSRVLGIIFGACTIVPFFLEILLIRFWDYDKDCYIGALRLLYLVIVVWGVDSGGYIFGKLFGRDQFAFKVSSQKTWQGFFGGLFTAIVVSYVYSMCVNVCFTPSISIICSVLISLASVLGDLTESMLKREAGIKNSSCLIPGHGGLLDRIDGLVAATPIFTYLLLLVFGSI